jgi:hypothetical protein
MNMLGLCLFIVQCRLGLYDESHALLGAFLGASIWRPGGLLFFSSVEGEVVLTDTAIKRGTTGEQDYKMADSGGLFLLVTKAGGKLWRWKYRFEGKEKKMSLGQYPEVMLAEVRVLHANARRLLVSGTRY